MTTKYCPRCNAESKVIDSRSREDGTIYRRRYCPVCGTWYKWSTAEISEERYKKLLKVYKATLELVGIVEGEKDDREPV